MFVKLFQQILESSISSDYELRHFWMDILILGDKNGVVDMTTESISRRIKLNESKVIEHIEKLCQPDPLSRSPLHDGRRLVLLDPRRSWGWQIVNYESYRAMRDEDDRREYNRNRQKDLRARKPKKKSGSSSALSRQYESVLKDEGQEAADKLL